MNRKATKLAERVLSLRTLERFADCGSFLQHLTNSELSVKRLHKANFCGNRFCPVCTWNKTKRDAIMISVIMQAIRIEKNRNLFL